mmetsp:Transcript_6875/g.20387  ORF Transcript_6875/g.20387 Transcript_6875/m.20387 type:complete len:226 (+) Transcript_6875:493-1170(+)
MRRFRGSPFGIVLDWTAQLPRHQIVIVLGELDLKGWPRPGGMNHVCWNGPVRPRHDGVPSEQRVQRVVHPEAALQTLDHLSRRHSSGYPKACVHTATQIHLVRRHVDGWEKVRLKFAVPGALAAHHIAGVNVGWDRRTLHLVGGKRRPYSRSANVQNLCQRPVRTILSQQDILCGVDGVGKANATITQHQLCQPFAVALHVVQALRLGHNPPLDRDVPPLVCRLC